MENTVLYNKDLEYLHVGSGFNGTCFQTKDNQVFKRIENLESRNYGLDKLLGINVPTYVFPKKLVSLNSVIIGYIMDYVEGIELKYLSSEVSLKGYLKALKEAENDIAMLTNLGIYSIDIGNTNVLYTLDGKFKVIDTDFYIKTKDKKGLYSHNLRMFSTTILKPLFDVYTSRFNDSILNHEKNKLIDGRLKPSKLIEMLLKYMDLNKEDGIQIGEFNKELKLLYKEVL